MVKLLLGLDGAPTPHDAADALAVAICHLHSVPIAGRRTARSAARRVAIAIHDRRTRARRAAWRQYPSARRRMIAFLRGRVLEKQPNRVIVDVQRRRLRGPRAAVDLLRARRRRAPRCRCASTRTCARTRCSCTAFSRELERQLFERLIGDQRHRSEAGDRGAVGHRAARTGRRRAARRRGAADRDSRRRQEDRRAHRARAEGSADADRRAGRRRRRHRRRQPADRLRDDLLSALQNLGYHRPLAEKAVECHPVRERLMPRSKTRSGSALRELMR